MRSLLIVNDLGIGIGGTQKRIYQLIKMLLQKNIFDKVFVLAHISAKQNADKEQNAENIIIEYSDKENIEQTMLSLIQENNIEIVQVHNLSLLSTEPIRIAKKMKRKVLFFAHDYWPICGRRSFYTKWKKPCSGPGIVKCNFCIGPLSYLHLKKRIQQQMNACDLGIATSNYMIDIYENNGILQGKWKQVTPWIEEEYIEKRKENKKIKKRQESEEKQKQKSVLYVGTLDKEKGFFDLLEVFLEGNKKWEDCQLIAVGDVSEENKEKIEKKLQEENAREKLKMIGYVAEKQELISYYKNADLFVFPSLLEESFGQTWAQALACGTPVIAYGTGSVRELLGNYGIIIQTGDKKQLKRAIEEFFFNNGEQKKAKEQETRRKEYAKNMFSIQNEMPLLEEIYKYIK